MSSSARLLIPVGLFVAFAFAHMMATRNELVKYELAVAKQKLGKGRQIAADQLESLTIYATANNNSIEKSFVSFGDRGQDVLYRTLNRDIQPGELIMLTDLLPDTGNMPLLEPNEVGLQVTLQGLEFSASQLKIGSNIGFMVEEKQPQPILGVDEEPARAPTVVPVVPRLLQPFRLVGIGDEVIPARDAGSETNSSNSKILTIAAELNGDTFDDKTNLLLRAASGNDSLRIINVVVLPQGQPAQGE